MSLNELDVIKHLEVVTFRRRILDVCEEAIKDRGGSDVDYNRLALYKYPPNIESSPDPPYHVRKAISDCKGVQLCMLSLPN